jgi:hypothetical protein
VTLSAEFPLIASFVISQSDTRGALLSTAAEVRRNAKSAAFRSWIYDIERKIRNQEDLVAVRQAQRELKSVVSELARELGLTRKDKQEVKLKLGVSMASVETTGNIALSAPQWVHPVLDRARPGERHFRWGSPQTESNQYGVAVTPAGVGAVV